MIDKDILLKNYTTIVDAMNNAQDKHKACLLAVSKGQSIEKISLLLAHGHRFFGENRIQEIQKKWPELRQSHANIELHLIGSLQTNKVEDAVALCDVIEVVDRESLVDALAKAEHKLNIKRQYYVQVNVGEETQKSGVALQGLASLMHYCQSKQLQVIGLMCIPPEGVSPSPYFALMKKLQRHYGLPKLSMGMSSDFAQALALGTSQVRIGTALFGERDL